MEDNLMGVSILEISLLVLYAVEKWFKPKLLKYLNMLRNIYLFKVVGKNFTKI